AKRADFAIMPSSAWSLRSSRGTHYVPGSSSIIIRWRIGDARACFIGVALQRQLDQPVQQLRIGDAACLPQLGIHADLGEARHGIDLVDVERAGIAVEEAIHPRQAAEV